MEIDLQHKIMSLRLLGMDTGFVSLDTNVVAKAYKTSKARLILLDYGVTIVSNDNVSRGEELNYLTCLP